MNISRVNYFIPRSPAKGRERLQGKRDGGIAGQRGEIKGEGEESQVREIAPLTFSLVMPLSLTRSYSVIRGHF